MIFEPSNRLEVSTPKGDGIVWYLIDYGHESNTIYAIIINETGEINKKSVDSLRNIYGSRMIPKEIKRREGEAPFMGADASDTVKKLMKKSKK
jgi:hypothetical protein